MTDKPPIGLRSIKIMKEQRIEEIKEAIIRYFEVNHMIPQTWINEYHLLVKEIKDLIDAK